MWRPHRWSLRVSAVKDPLCVNTTRVVGEGLFARRNIRNGSLICLFSGAKKRHFRNDMFQFSDYMIRVDETCSIDIPDYYIPTLHYSATLGHKVNSYKCF